MKIYQRLPVIGQNLACHYEGKRIKRSRYSLVFWNFLKEYEARNHWSYEELCVYRDQRLQRMIKHCCETVPYYKQLFKHLGISAQDIKTIDDLKILPILDKQIVNENFEAFISDSFNRKDLVLAHTSGTTGSGFKFYTTKEAINEQWALWWRYRRNLGIEYGTWCGVFGSKLIVPTKQESPPYWRMNTPNKQIYFSAFHQNEENLYAYFSEIKKRKLKWLHGFPSLITLLASFIEKNNLDLGYKMKYITIGAENLLTFQQNVIQKAFGTKVFQHYGLAEGVSNFSENKNTSIYVDEDFAVSEFISDENNTKVIGTNLTNDAMPLIRYDTKDLASCVYDEKAKRRKIINLDGRTEDYITLKNGRKIGKLDHVFKDTVNFSEVQLVQREDYSISVSVVEKRINTNDDEKIAMYHLRESLGDDIEISFSYVKEIPRTESFKLRFVISKIKNEGENGF